MIVLRQKILPALYTKRNGLAPATWCQTINAPAGRTLFNRSSLVRSFAEFDRFSLDADGNSVHGTQYVTPLAFVYGCYLKWTAIVAQPYVVTDVTIRAGSQTQHQSL